MLALLVSVYLVRTGLMNCTYPLEESILMDFVPRLGLGLGLGLGLL